MPWSRSIPFLEGFTRDSKVWGPCWEALEALGSPLLRVQGRIHRLKFSKIEFARAGVGWISRGIPCRAKRWWGAIRHPICHCFRRRSHAHRGSTTSVCRPLEARESAPPLCHVGWGLACPRRVDRLTGPSSRDLGFGSAKYARDRDQLHTDLLSGLAGHRRLHIRPGVHLVLLEHVPLPRKPWPMTPHPGARRRDDRDRASWDVYRTRTPRQTIRRLWPRGVIEIRVPARALGLPIHHEVRRYEFLHEVRTRRCGPWGQGRDGP